MSRPAKYGEKTELRRIPVSLLPKIDEILANFVQNPDKGGEAIEVPLNSVQNAEGNDSKAPAPHSQVDPAIASVAKLAQVLKFLELNQDRRIKWAIEYKLRELWKFLNIPTMERQTLKVRTTDTGEIREVDEYRAVLSKFGELSLTIKLKTPSRTGAYWYSADRLEFLPDQGEDNEQAA